MNSDEGVVYHAGFPNAAEDASAVSLSLDKLIYQHTASTYLWRLGEDIADLAWKKGDIVVIDRALLPKHQDIVAIQKPDKFVLRQFTKNQISLMGLDGQVDTGPGELWGVVTYVIHQVRS